MMTLMTRRTNSAAVVIVALLALVFSMLVAVITATPAQANGDVISVPVQAGGQTTVGGDGAFRDVTSDPRVREETNTGKKASGGDGTTRAQGNGYTDITTVTTTSTFTPCATRTIDTGNGIVTQMPTHKTQTQKVRYYPDDSPGAWLHNNGKAITVNVGSSSVQCHYPAAWQDVRVTCITSLNLNVSQVVPTARNIFTKNVPTAFSSNRTLANCLNSGGTVSANIPLSDFGRYQGTGESRAVSCYHRTYTSANADGIIPGDQIVNCGNEYPLAGMNSRAQIDCSGAYPRWVNNGASYTMTECSNQQSTTPSYQCVVGDTVQVNGIPLRNVELMRDGSPNTLQWNTPSLAGNDIRSFTFNGTTMARSGSPWIKGAGNTDRNVFELGTSKTGGKSSLLTTDAGSKRQGGVQNTWYGRWYTTSDVGVPTKLTPTFDFNATVRTTTYTITSFDLRSGAWNITATNRDIATSGRCNGPTLNVSTLKVVNSVG